MRLVTREEFARELLHELEAPVSKRTLWAIVSWIQAEGSRAAFNPLATTQPMPGATDFNWVGVKNYTSLEQGVKATAKTLDYGARKNIYGYRPIRRGLRQNRWASKILAAVEGSAWGTGGLALLCLPWVKLSWNRYRNMLIST